MFDLTPDAGCEETPTILAIDDDRFIRTLLERLIQSAGFRCILAENGPSGVALAEEHRPNAIILDVEMPGMDGYEACEKLKSQLSTADIPVIFVTGTERTNEAVEHGFAIGANDFLAKPINRVDLFARIRVVLREQALREAFRRLATQDALTGLLNRRQFFLNATEAIIQARHGGESVLLLADLDKFKSVNDTYGHDFGDEVLVTFSRLLKRATNRNCHAGRIGGEEFAVVLCHADRSRGLALGEQIRQTFAAVEFDAETEPKHFSASFGVAAYSGEPKDFTPDAFLKQADIALYAAKERGRNCVVPFWGLDDQAMRAVPAEKQHARSQKRTQTERAYVGVSPDPSGNPPSTTDTGEPTLRQ
ncbi:MAG: diguanylate cyclase domain-containing protein [Phycisphaerae bacterium]